MNILWVEDSEDDILLFVRAMYRSRQTVAFQHVSDGAQAIDYLLGNGPYIDRIEFPLPDVIVTDIKMPIVGGVELLRWLRGHPRFKTIPVLVLSASALERDLATAALLGAADYVVKPAGEPAWERLYASVLTKCRVAFESPRANTPCSFAAPLAP